MMFTSNWVNWGCDPFFLEQLAWFIKKFKRFNHNDIICDITALTLALSVNGPIVLYQSSGGIQKVQLMTEILCNSWTENVKIVGTGLIVIIQWYLPLERAGFSRSSEGTEIIGGNTRVNCLLQEHKTSSYKTQVGREKEKAHELQNVCVVVMTVVKECFVVNFQNAKTSHLNHGQN